MSGGYNYEFAFVVYELLPGNEVRQKQQVMHLIHRHTFERESEAENWIDNDAESNRNYTILQVYRKR